MTASSALADRVRNTRGVFGFSKPFRFIHRLFIALFAFVFPAFFAYVIYSSGIPLHSLNADVWVGALLIPASMVIGDTLYWGTRIRWEFTDTEIVALKGSSVAWRLAYAEITAAEIRTVFRGMRVLWLESDKGQRSIVFSDPLLVRSIDAPSTGTQASSP